MVCGLLRKQVPAKSPGRQVLENAGIVLAFVGVANDRDFQLGQEPDKIRWLHVARVNLVTFASTYQCMIGTAVLEWPLKEDIRLFSESPPRFRKSIGQQKQCVDDLYHWAVLAFAVHFDHRLVADFAPVWIDVRLAEVPGARKLTWFDCELLVEADDWERLDEIREDEERKDEAGSDKGTAESDGQADVPDEALAGEEVEPEAPDEVALGGRLPTRLAMRLLFLMRPSAKQGPAGIQLCTSTAPWWRSTPRQPCIQRMHVWSTSWRT